MHTDYIYSEKSRRPITFLALALSVFMMMFGFKYAAPWYFLVAVGVAAAMSAAMVLRNRKSGLSLTGSSFYMYAGHWDERIAVTDITEMRVTRWSDGAPSAALLLTSGEEISIPGYCLGSAKALEDALSSRNIPTHWIL